MVFIESCSVVARIVTYVRLFPPRYPTHLCLAEVYASEDLCMSRLVLKILTGVHDTEKPLVGHQATLEQARKTCW